MTEKVQLKNLTRQAYFIGLVLTAVGLTLSPFLMGMSQFWLAAVWIADGIVNKDFSAKWHAFSRNKTAVLLVSLYLLHVVGLVYTSDFSYAFKDLRVKLPLLVLPFVMSSMPALNRKQGDGLIKLYVLSVFVATWFSFAAYLKHDYEDVREISRFISHIRFCLQIVFCVFILGYYLYTERQKSKWMLVVYVMLMLWFCYQVYIFETLSGYVVLAAALMVSIVYAFLRWKNGAGWRIGIVVLALTALVLGSMAVYRMAKPMMTIETVDFDKLEKKTALGNDYWHDTIYNHVEDGRYVGLYYCRKELQETWPKRSGLAWSDKTANGEDLESTLARYLTSKGLRKDAEGVMALTDEDVRNIEQGVANYNNWLQPGLRARLSSTIFEYNVYRRFNNPNGGSLSQRIEYTRASLYLIRKHWLFGVGTGDVPNAFRQAYEELHSPLKEEFRHKAHNQYLSITVGFGVVGLALFLVVLFYPYLSAKRNRHYLYTIFLCILVLSMFPEDTIETQAGAMFYAFFSALFLLGLKREDSSSFEKDPQKIKI